MRHIETAKYGAAHPISIKSLRPGSTFLETLSSMICSWKTIALEVAGAAFSICVFSHFLSRCARPLIGHIAVREVAGSDDYR